MASVSRTIAACAFVATICVAADRDAGLAGRSAFADPANPPPWIQIHPAARRDFDLGHALFNSQWAPAVAVSATGNFGLGPQFIETSCDACHDDGARGKPAIAPAVVPKSLVMQLGGELTDYGHVISTRAVEGHAPEGRITLTHRVRSGRYDDGQRWSLREPRYALSDLTLGSLPVNTVLKPRIAPALFGVGLLDAVPQSAVESIRITQAKGLRGSADGRFGWQGNVASLVDQTAIAFAREMGLTSELQLRDDCSPRQVACLQAPQAGTPELAERIFHAVNTFQFLLAAPARAPIDAAADEAGEVLFERVGCAGCHVPHLPVPRDAGDIRIDPRSDLLRHDLGDGLADRTVAGRPVQSLWRTAPLWGLAYALRAGPVALLHDGRAASIEEAILWHEGQADPARRHFMALDAAARQQLLAWISTL